MYVYKGLQLPFYLAYALAPKKQVDDILEAIQAISKRPITAQDSLSPPQTNMITHKIYIC